MHPVGEIQFMDFVTLSMEQLVLQAAKVRFMFGGKANVPMVLRMPAGSGTGAAAQHSESLENLFVHIPGLKVVMPSNPYDAKGLPVGDLRRQSLAISPSTVALQDHGARTGRDVPGPAQPEQCGPPGPGPDRGSHFDHGAGRPGGSRQV
jgi:hypothetical protein